ncbi:sensor histidine kinase [Modestobacter lapidis]
MTRWWGSRSDAQRIDLYTRWSFYGSIVALPPLLLFAVAPAWSDAGNGVALVLLVGSLATTAGCLLLARQGFTARATGAGPARRESTAALVPAGLTAVAGVAATAPGAGVSPSAPWVVGLVAAAVLLALSVTWPMGRLAWAAGGAGLLAAGAALIDGDHPVPALVVGLSVAFALTGVAAAFRFTVWILDVVLQMERSRGIQLQLAVAEERLRFARDLHDVMGRDLSTIAVKSQLAGELVRRGRPGAAEEVADISRIAEASLREVRDVVRGYRTADLPGELAGARSVLRAAGVSCTVGGEDTATGLPVEVQAALGWVVREAVTNVLRHSRATACDISLGVEEDGVRLVVDNDGATDGPVARGNGLTGLGERLAGAGGRLTVRAEHGRFRLTATVPPAVPW